MDVDYFVCLADTTVHGRSCDAAGDREEMGDTIH
jgi:hypothetical protein